MNPKTFFAPQLYIPSGITDVSFYERAFGAKELRRFTNDDGSIHVVEFSIGEMLFHLHEENLTKAEVSPQRINATTVIIGLFVADVDKAMSDAVKAGAIVMSPAQSYEYGYRQGEIKDPFAHLWLIEAKI